MNKFDFKLFAQRILGIIILVIGFWLLMGLFAGFMDIYQSAQGQRDFKALYAMDGCALLLIGGVGSLAYNPDAAIALFEQARKLTQESLAIIFELNGSYISRGTSEKALSLIKENAERIIKEYGQKDYDRYLALLYAAESDIAVKKRDYKVAESTLRTALELNSANTSYTLKLAGLVHKSGRFDEAIRILIAWQKTALMMSAGNKQPRLLSMNVISNLLCRNLAKYS